MSESSTSGTELVPVGSGGLMVSERLKPLFDFYYAVVTQVLPQIEASNPKYLDLPPTLASLAADRSFLAARPLGRFQYRDEMYVYDEASDRFYRCPEPYTREDIMEMVDSNIRLSDRVLAATVPLGWRVGFVVGWLSALSVAQPDDAQAGMVILAALVAPLLLSAQNARSLAAPQLTGRKRSRKGGVI